MEQKSVLIGMSGGVDSSVAAALLKEQGYHVIGATMRLWTYSDSCNMKHEGCCAESAVEDARRVCDKLGIDFYVMNFKDMFKDKSLIILLMNIFTAERQIHVLRAISI